MLYIGYFFGEFLNSFFMRHKLSTGSLLFTDQRDENFANFFANQQKKTLFYNKLKLNKSQSRLNLKYKKFISFIAHKKTQYYIFFRLFAYFLGSLVRCIVNVPELEGPTILTRFSVFF